ncbi:response regulator [Saccharospirillum impatiens]|jgi:CheY-like chemotaxis protein|uniref:response regulator n=1 Tax=Saccharospirillum impatiens TaxID=169438 RepID=UPI00048DBFD8|nr:response regulator [Saccharospirillum impatiens]
MPLNHIMHVEDDPDIRAIAELALATVGGLNITQCTSGRECLAVVEECIPDLILLDVMMPDLDGPETLRRLRTLPGMSEVPAVFMTARCQPDEISGYQALGAIGVIPKPFDPLTLADQVRQLWDQSQAAGG